MAAPDAMTWKTDWTAADDYGYNPDTQAIPMQRLIDTLQEIYDWISSDFGRSVAGFVPFADPLSISTIPFASLLNQLEGNIQSLRIWNVPSWPARKYWASEMSAPDALDVNRWEQSGKLLESCGRHIEDGYVYCGNAYSGG